MEFDGLTRNELREACRARIAGLREAGQSLVQVTDQVDLEDLMGNFEYESPVLLFEELALLVESGFRRNGDTWYAPPTD